MSKESPKENIVYDPRKHGSLPEFLDAQVKAHGPIVKVTARDKTPEELMESDAQAEEAFSINPAMWPRRKMVLETLRLALKEKAPKTYRELSDSGELQRFLEGRADVIAEAADFAATNAPGPPETDWLEAVRFLDMTRNTAWKIALEEGIVDLPYDEREEDAEEEYECGAQGEQK